MNPQSRIWLGAAAAVTIVVAVVVLLFGYNRPPEFASLYTDDGPAVTGTVAYMEFGREDCIHIFDVTSGESRELYCDNWVWPQGWDENGNLLVHAGNGHEQIWVLDPGSGDILASKDIWDDPHADEGGPPPPEDSPLRSRSTDGRVTLTHGFGADSVTLIDVEAPRNYAFTNYGFTSDGDHAWVCDTEDRLLVVASDGQSDPWLVAEGISDPLWN